MWFGNGQPHDYLDPDYTDRYRKKSGKGNKFFWILLALLILVGYIYFR